MRRVLLVLAALAVALTAAATPAGAVTRARCRGGHSGPMCFFWTGKVIAINDGDTITVDIDGDHTSHPFKVRLSSVQAMEQTVYSHIPSRRRGECHALEATSRIEHLIRQSHLRVKLSAQHRNAMSDTRLRRSVW